ncbi:hypothetical protein TUMEXPCC7403_13305 [Tumidithrix helvetica PCC 7403]|uniref:hypothetical protein n=1 Tax=Tumidithrix helvetica TaxID=3457545 RepID=UPI003CAFB407
MSQVLTLELSDDDYAEIKLRSEIAGVPIAEWAIASLKKYTQASSAQQKSKISKDLARQRFRRHAGAICLGTATGADNESIDADLAKAYGYEVGEIA